MTCRRCQQLRDAFADGRLDPRLQADVQDHLEVCGRCRDAFAWIVTLRRRLDTGRVAAPAALDRTVMAAMRRHAERKPLWDSLRSGFRSWRAGWDPVQALAMLAGTPITVLLFGLVLAQFSATPLTSWYPVYTAGQPPGTRNDAMLQLSYAPMLRFAETSADRTPDDSFVVLARVDRDGITTLQEVVQAPRHPQLLHLFAQQGNGVRQVPPQKRSGALDYYLIVPYQKISVVG